MRQKRRGESRPWRDLLVLNYAHQLTSRPRILTMDRAQLGGLDDVGIGALFGLAGKERRGPVMGTDLAPRRL